MHASKMTAILNSWIILSKKDGNTAVDDTYAPSNEEGAGPDPGSTGRRGTRGRSRQSCTGRGGEAWFLILCEGRGAWRIYLSPPPPPPPPPPLLRKYNLILQVPSSSFSISLDGFETRPNPNKKKI